MDMIELTGINKIYRTNEIETQALENVESTLEDAYLYHTQITGGEKNATL